MKLMLIEENAGLRRLLRRLLRNSGADLCECIEGTAAVSLCVLEQPDWAVVDMNLARANGLQVLEQIHAACPQTRLIVIADEDSPRLRGAGADGGRR